MIYLARIGFFILTINLFPNALSSQNLTFDINYASDEVLVGEDSVGVFYGSIINTSSENINIRLLRSENVTNLGWTSSICIGSLCYSNWVDSVNVNIVNGDSADFSIYVWTNGEGNDSLSFSFFDLNHLSETVDLNIFIATQPLVSVFVDENKSSGSDFLKVYPNPFNSSLKIQYSLDKTSLISVNIYDLKGRLVSSIFKGYRGSGENYISWNPTKGNNVIKSSGFFICRIDIDGTFKSKKILYLK